MSNPLTRKTLDVYYYPLSVEARNCYNLDILKKHYVNGVHKFIPIKSIKEIEFENYEFQGCPAWHSWASSSFVFFSQEDVMFKYDKENKVIPVNNLDDPIRDKLNLSYDWNTGKTPTFQLNQHCLFWTENKNVWLEQIPFGTTSRFSNIDLIPAHFPFSGWTRVVSMGFKIINVDKPVIIKKGTPLYTVRFISPDYPEVNLQYKEPPQSVLNTAMENVAFKLKQPNKSWGIIQKLLGKQKDELETEKQSKCPFAFLFKEESEQTTDLR